MPNLQLFIWGQNTNPQRDFLETECKCNRKFFSMGGEGVKVIRNYKELNMDILLTPFPRVRRNRVL